MTHSMISWEWTNLMWPIPPKKSCLLARNATCSVIFEWHLRRITLMSYHQKKNMFFIWPGGGFPLFVCGTSQKKSVDFRFLGTTPSLLYFLQSTKWTVSFFRVSSHFSWPVRNLNYPALACKWIPTLTLHILSYNSTLYYFLPWLEAFVSHLSHLLPAQVPPFQRYYCYVTDLLHFFISSWNFINKAYCCF